MMRTASNWNEAAIVCTALSDAALDLGLFDACLDLWIDARSAEVSSMVGEPYSPALLNMALLRLSVAGVR